METGFVLYLDPAILIGAVVLVVAILVIAYLARRR